MRTRTILNAVENEEDRNHHGQPPPPRLRWQHRLPARYYGAGGTLQETGTRQTVTDKRNKTRVTNNKKHSDYGTERFLYL
jgi:hypothetical protein